MSLRVAITRAMPEAEATAARVRAMGGEPVLAPLLAIEPRQFATNLDGVQALLFTSANGVRAFADATRARDAPALAVGAATAEAARRAGFADVRTAGGDVAALAELARSELGPASGKLLHISGVHVAGDLAGALAGAGFEIERRIAYEARPAAAIPGALLGPVDVVLFHSARAAETFVSLGAPNAEKLTAACISPAVAAAARKARWKCIVVASAPSEEALLAAALAA